MEIVSRGKDRAEKSEEDLEIDDDSMILRTSAEAIRLLCRFGSRKEAEKAVEIGARIEKWLEQFAHIKSTASEAGSVASVDTTVAPRALAIAFYAIGISQAHWARFTYDADARTAIQTKAIQYLRKSLEPRFEDHKSIEAMYALGLILAEMRDIPGAIKVVKRALSPATKDKTSISADGVISGGVATDFGRERKLIPMWHLLGLLLTTRSDFTAAEKACEAAFEQFGDPAVLFGKDDENAIYRSEHLNQANGTDAATKPIGVVDQMENFEKSGILQIKMTQLALMEVIDGPNAAVDGCDELLALYSRLFGDPAAPQAKLQAPTPMVVPPKSAVGTIRGSIFRGKGSVKTTAKDLPGRNSSVTSSRPSDVATQGPGAPDIQVTDENGTDHAKQHHHSLLHHYKNDGTPSGVTRSPSKLQKRSANSLRRRSESQPEHPSDLPDIPDGASNGTPDRSNMVQNRARRQASISSSIRKSVESQERPLRSVARNMDHTTAPPPLSHPRQPPQQDTRLPAPFPSATYIPPDPRFSKLQVRRHQVSLLSDIWIYISGLYTRAEMYEDARDAVDEARKLAETFESEVAHERASSKAFADRGWGGGRSVEELWAHYFAAVSYKASCFRHLTYY
jgi:tetratricopeptide (TPR) repeat protein